jgi:hypothetical protein
MESRCGLSPPAPIVGLRDAQPASKDSGSTAPDHHSGSPRAADLLFTVAVTPRRDRGCCCSQGHPAGGPSGAARNANQVTDR